VRETTLGKVMRESPLLLPLECGYAAKFVLRMAKSILRNDIDIYITKTL